MEYILLYTRIRLKWNRRMIVALGAHNLIIVLFVA